MTDDDKATIAEFEIFSGKFDHWGEIDQEMGRYECGNCGGGQRNSLDATHAFRRHLRDAELDTVIEAMGQRP